MSDKRRPRDGEVVRRLDDGARGVVDNRGTPVPDGVQVQWDGERMKDIYADLDVFHRHVVGSSK